MSKENDGSLLMRDHAEYIRKIVCYHACRCDSVKHTDGTRYKVRWFEKECMHIKHTISIHVTVLD
jgi:hypothetical protein